MHVLKVNVCDRAALRRLTAWRDEKHDIALLSAQARREAVGPDQVRALSRHKHKNDIIALYKHKHDIKALFKCTSSLDISKFPA